MVCIWTPYVYYSNASLMCFLHIQLSVYIHSCFLHCFIMPLHSLHEQQWQLWTAVIGDLISMFTMLKHKEPVRTKVTGSAPGPGGAAS